MMKCPKIQEVVMELEDLFSEFWVLHYFMEVNGVSQKNALSFSCDCAKLGFAIHFKWQLPNVIAPSISNRLP
jgi:hypothetical protein